MNTYAIVIQGEVTSVAQMDDETVNEVRALIDEEPLVSGQVVSVTITTNRFAVLDEVEAAIDMWRL